MAPGSRRQAQHYGCKAGCPQGGRAGAGGSGRHPGSSPLGGPAPTPTDIVCVLEPGFNRIRLEGSPAVPLAGCPSGVRQQDLPAPLLLQRVMLRSCGARCCRASGTGGHRRRSRSCHRHLQAVGPLRGVSGGWSSHDCRPDERDEARALRRHSAARRAGRWAGPPVAPSSCVLLRCRPVTAAAPWRRHGIALNMQGR